MKSSLWKLNTSNLGKAEEFARLFAGYELELTLTTADLKEIDADSLLVVVHKASQLDNEILVDDTSLHIEGASVGIHIRWLLDHLADYAGRKAEWVVLLAYRKGKEILVYKGSLTGTIVEPKGASGFGFDAAFLPDGAAHTLAQSKPDRFNARAKAVEALVKGDLWTACPAIEKWEGAWQEDHLEP